MALIVDRVSGDRAVQLGNEEFVRQMAFGNNWWKIRIGMRVAIAGGADIVAPRLQVGVCSGINSPFSAANCTGYVGGTWPNGGFNANYNPNAGNSYYQYSGGGATAFMVTKRVGNTTTDIVGSSGIANYVVTTTNGTAKSTVYLTDISRVAGDSSAFSVITWATIGGSVTLNPTTYAFLRCMEDEYITNAFTQNYVATGMQGAGPYIQRGLPVYMDSMSIYWNKSTPTIDVAEICVIRFQ